MGEVFVSASLLIVIILVLRYFTKGKISHRLQYAIWLLVLVRLLVPVSFGESNISVMNAVSDSSIAQQTVNVLPIERIPVEEATNVLIENDQIVADVNSFGYATLSQDGKTVVRYAERMTASEVFMAIWVFGAIIVALWFGVVNYNFYRRLRKSRQLINTIEAPLTVYQAKNIASPCLFGLWKPSIYLTGKALADEEGAKYVLAHELCHYRHADHIWSMLRIVCLVIWWWNPLVWVAARCAQLDGELACDEGTLKHMDPQQRLAYGRTLVDMIAVKVSANDFL